MMTKEEYMQDSNKNYAEYHRQFVTEAVKAIVLRAIGLGPIVGSPDFYLNDVYIQKWEALHEKIKALTFAQVKATGNWFDVYVSVSIAKAAAREIQATELDRISQLRPFADIGCGFNLLRIEK
ncbi:MAG: hypothetical protein Q7S87_03190 [Agitococcus sp.]|nr:hypothetical protein [Agitococcus sp.]MDO9178641.1 hypothetical protein [Agitococcus sp.]